MSKKEAAIIQGAVEQFFKEEFSDGDVVSHLWLKTYLDIEEPKRLDDVQRLQFLMLSRIEDFKTALLVDYKIALENVRGEGYRIVPPNDQAEFAVSEASRLIKKGIDRGVKYLGHARLDQMSDEAHKRHTDATVKMAGLQKLMAHEKRDIWRGWYLEKD